jgi:hypothetical protein
MSDRERFFRDWIESTEDAVKALQSWIASLKEWQQNGGKEMSPGDFDAAWSKLSEQGLGDWLDWHPCDLDRLAAVVGGESHGSNPPLNVRKT